MAKNYFGVVLTTKEHDKYRLVVYRYKDPGILNTCPMCQLLRAIHKFQQEYAEIHREHCSRIPPRKWYELGRVMPSIVLRKYGLEKHYEMSFEPSRVPPASALKLIHGATASNWKQYIGVVLTTKEHLVCRWGRDDAWLKTIAHSCETHTIRIVR